MICQNLGLILVHQWYNKFFYIQKGVSILIPINKIHKETKALKKQCEPFLTISKLSDEEKAELEKTPTPLQIKAFDTIVNECKKEVQSSSTKKMSHILKLLYDIETDPFDYNEIGKAMENFSSSQLKHNLSGISASHIEDMGVMVDNISNVLNSLVAEYQNLAKENKKWYVFQGKRPKVIATLIQDLSKLKSNLELQMEYDAKKLTELIIDDFYNIYIFFSYLIHFAISQNQQLLSIEIANFLDKYIQIINPIFNKRSLKSQDMLYHYVLYELRELKVTIFENISSSYDKRLI